MPDGPFETLLWQAVIGAWPASRERLQGYAEKAAREAGNSTTWTNPDAEFEARVKAAVDAAFDDARVTTVVEDFVARIDSAATSNSLSAKIIQLTMPGVPDVYQGSEFWERSLTDPDNRRPVDFAQREKELATIDAGTLAGSRHRNQQAAGDLPCAAASPRPAGTVPGLPAGLRVRGRRPARAGVRPRSGALTLATRLPFGLERAGGWRDTAVELSTALRDELTGRMLRCRPGAGGRRPRTYPVALLVPVDGENA